jgi:hypothetical protein
MIEINAGAPGVDVQPSEYVRLLGYPAGAVLEDRAAELAVEAREWYAKHGRPWVYVRHASSLQIGDDAVVIDGIAFGSTRLRNAFYRAGAHGAVLAAVSAGLELETEAQARWRDEKPDEYFFLEVYGSAVVEHLVTTTGARLCDWAEARGAAVLPHYSPGYPDWTIDEQPRLLELIRSSCPAPMPIEVLESGMLRPKKSLLAVFGLTHHVDRVRRLTDLSACENCSFGPCQYRRAPYRRSLRVSGPGAAAADGKTMPLTRDARYTVSLKALRRWSAERLQIATGPDGSVEALFRYEGTTCTNMGRALHFHYHVTLGPRDQGYPIREQWCRPAPGDQGHTSMCRYTAVGEQLMETVAGERPLNGQRLDDVLQWIRPSSPAGCYCDEESRQHKWGLVLETIHYTLAQEADPS